jgi:hypothetical protein
MLGATGGTALLQDGGDLAKGLWWDPWSSIPFQATASFWWTCLPTITQFPSDPHKSGHTHTHTHTHTRPRKNPRVAFLCSSPLELSSSERLLSLVSTFVQTTAWPHCSSIPSFYIFGNCVFVICNRTYKTDGNSWLMASPAKASRVRTPVKNETHQLGVSLSGRVCLACVSPGSVPNTHTHTHTFMSDVPVVKSFCLVGYTVVMCLHDKLIALYKVYSRHLFQPLLPAQHLHRTWVFNNKLLTRIPNCW